MRKNEKYSEDISVLLTLAKKYHYTVSTLLSCLGHILRCGIFAMDSSGLCIGGYQPSHLNSDYASELNLCGRLSRKKITRLLDEGSVCTGNLCHRLISLALCEDYTLNLLLIGSNASEDMCEAAVQCVADYVSHLIEKTSGNFSDVSLLNHALNEVFSGAIVSEDKIMSILGDERPKPYYWVFAAGFDDGPVNYRRFLSFMFEIQKIVVDCKATIYNGCIVCMVPANPAAPSRYDMVRASWEPSLFRDGHSFSSVNSLMEELKARLVHNAPLKNLPALPTIVKQLKDALDISMKFTLPGQYSRMYPMEDYQILTIEKDFFERWLLRNNPQYLKYLIFSDITPVLYYDYVNKQNLAQFLFCHISLGSDAGKTAKAMFMHKNTVYNKINQVQKLINIDFKNTSSLTLIMDSLKIYFFVRSYFELDLPEIFFGTE